LLALVALVALPDCGARTGIELAEACAQAGATRACQAACGAGVETCAAGFWGECQVPKIEIACSGVCGPGIQTCEGGVLGACVIPVVQRDCSSVCGRGHETCEAGKWGACDAPLPKPPVLHTTIRDFHQSQTDFELPVFGNVDDRGMVEPFIGRDRKPVYAGRPTTRTTPAGKASFDLWYNDAPGINQTTSYDLQLTEDPRAPGNYLFEDRTFFPIDARLFGNEGNSHNFHFTLETHTQFVYRGGEVFTFAGDDDVWVFIADQLVIDLGGLHQIETATVKLDQQRDKLNLVPGQKYPLDLFFAERHKIDSDFIVDTTIADVGSCE